MENITTVFFEAAWDASVVPLASEATLFALLAFDKGNLPVLLAVAIIGAVIGQLFNWWVGTLLKRVQMQNKLNISQDYYAKSARLFNYYGVFLLLLCWFSLFNVIVVIAGFLGTRLRIMLPLVIIAEVGYYLLPLFLTQ